MRKEEIICEFSDIYIYPHGQWTERYWYVLDKKVNLRELERYILNRPKPRLPPIMRKLDGTPIEGFALWDADVYCWSERKRLLLHYEISKKYGRGRISLIYWYRL